MTELERVYDAEVVEEDTWNIAVSEWASGHEQELRGRLRQARAAAAVQTRYGQQSIEEFAYEVGASRSKVYEYAKAYSTLLREFGDHDQISERLDNSPLRISNVLEAAKEEDVRGALDEAQDDGLSSRQQRAKREEREIPRNVETIEIVACPHCGSEYPLAHANTRTEERRA